MRQFTALPVFTLIALSLSTACSTAQTPQSTSIEADSAPLSMTFPVIISDRSEIGTATITDAPNGVVMRLTLAGLPSGWHGMHFHVKADCGDAAFKNSGGHINPSGRQHGLLNPDGPDNADMPNIYADEMGRVNVEVYSTRVSLDSSDILPTLLDADGSALVIHTNPDDQMSQPIGGAGARIACAVIKTP